MSSLRLPVPARPVTRLARWRRVVALAAVPLLAAAGIALGATPASAAVISGAITNVAVTPTTPAPGQQLTTSIDWQVPDNAQAGDTFTLTLSSVLRNLPSDFALRDPDGGAVVATAALSSTSPVVITFTLTDYASTHLDTHGTAFVTSDYSSVQVPPGASTPITSVTGDGVSFTTVITRPGSVSTRSVPIKSRAFTSADQGHTNPVDFLAWWLDTPVGPFDSAVSSDTVPTGQNWFYDCSTIRYQDVAFTPGTTTIASITTTVPASQSCTEAGYTATWPAAAADHAYRVSIRVSLREATGSETAAQTFSNVGTVATTVAGATRTQRGFASISQAAAGGVGAGTNPTASVSIVKGDSLGNAADTAADVVTLATNGTASLVYKVTNTGTDPLRDVSVVDDVVANGTVTGLSCDFSPLGGPATGTTWAGRFAPGASFTCTADLSGVRSGDIDHQDVGTVTGTGVTSGTAVTSSNAYFARVNAVTPTGPNGGNGTTPPAGGGTTPVTPGTPTTPVVVVPVTPAAAGLTPTLGGSATPVATGALAYTGTDVRTPLTGVLVLLGLGLLLSVIARRRRSAAGRLDEE